MAPGDVTIGRRIPATEDGKVPGSFYEDLRLVGENDVAWIVAETPSEVAEMVAAADPEAMIELTLANQRRDEGSGGWNGKPLYLRARSVTQIAPPRNDRVADEAT